MYWATRPELLYKRRRIFVCGIYLWSVVMVDFHYAAKLGVIAVEDPILYAITTSGIALGCIFAYYIPRKNIGE
jgi:hypothetical protein